jgi:serine protease Do
MESELDLIKKFEAYLHQELSADDLIAFEQERKNNVVFEQKFIAHLAFIKDLKSYGERKNLSEQMDKIHATLDISLLKEQVFEKPALIISLWKKHKKNLAVAASVAIVFTMVTLVFTGFFKNGNQNTSYSALKRDMESIKRSQNALIRNINNKSKDIAPSQFGGTGFALTSSGYLVTNYHVVEGADSVYVQNSKGESFKVKTIYVDPSSDIAVLQIDDQEFKNLSPLPYAFKKTSSDIGEDVYTIGYPKDDVVYGKGYLSSATGFGGDSIAYQISIPVNPGNSGGPLLDSKGNVIGIVSGKQTQADGAAFAIKSDFLLKAIDNIPQDSLTKKIIINKKNTLASLSRTQQIKKLQDYIFVVKVYNN